MRAVLRIATVAAVAGVLLSAASLTGAESIQKGHLRVAFSGSIAPRELPRRGSAPVRLEVGGRVSATDGGAPPRLRRIEFAFNRIGRLSTAGLPACELDDIQPATTRAALSACRASLVGDGLFTAKVLVPGQAPFPSRGKVHAFFGTYEGRPAVLAHVYGTKPIRTSFTIPFELRRAGGRFANVLTASLPTVTSEWGHITGLSLSLFRRYRHGGRLRSFISAGCPLPPGVRQAGFPLARASFVFVDGRNLSSQLVRSCSAR